MQEVIQFNSHQSVRIDNENVGAILLDISALQADGITVAVLADLNKISVELGVYRNGSAKPEYVFNDYLDNVLIALSGGTTRYDIATTVQSKRLLIALGLGGSLNLQGKDHAIFKCRAQNTAFTSLSTATSDITVETVASTKHSPTLNVVEGVPYVTGEINVNKKLGDGITKIVMANDFTAPYSTTAKAKPTNGIVLNANGFSKEASENLLVSENLHYLQNNPATAVKQLLLYNNPNNVLNNVRLTCKLSAGADADARLLLVRRKRV